jgi:hypothetical protein
MRITEAVNSEYGTAPQLRFSVTSLVQWSPGFHSRPVYMRSGVDKLSLGQTSRGIILSPLLCVISAMLYTPLPCTYALLAQKLIASSLNISLKQRIRNGCGQRSIFKLYWIKKIYCPGINDQPRIVNVTQRSVPSNKKKI